MLAAVTWSVLLLPLVQPHPGRAALVLILTAVIVQLASPWESPPLPIEKKVRWRLA